jgi:dihydrofolate reductase
VDDGGRFGPGPLEAALDAADGEDVRVAGGTAAIRQYLRAGLVDKMHRAFVPILLGGGDRFFDHLEGGPDGYECVEFVSSPSVVHARFARRSQ